MNRDYNSRVSSKNSERLLKNLKNTTGDYFFMPHPVYVEFSIMASVLLLGKLPQQFWALSATFSGKT